LRWGVKNVVLKQDSVGQQSFWFRLVEAAAGSPRGFSLGKTFENEHSAVKRRQQCVDIVEKTSLSPFHG
jgi:hypothetical protein